ncbi:MAG: hypothetical protein ACYTG2_06490 [Planctomycetota bacterium]|jgi:hypothetical protein
MRKVLIGCGVLVLLAMGFIGYVGYHLWPSVSGWHEAWIEAVGELDALDAQHPFDPEAQAELDVERFDLMLDVRVQLAEYFTEFHESLRDIEERDNQEDEPGWLELSSSLFEIMSPMLHEFAMRLGNAGMGPTEFSWHTRVLWAALARVDAGVAGPELESLRGEYSRFREGYERQARQQAEMISLEDLVRSVPPEMLVQAAEVLARDPARVKGGLTITDFDYLYLQQPKNIEDLMEVAVQPLEEGASTEGDAR